MMDLLQYNKLQGITTHRDGNYYGPLATLRAKNPRYRYMTSDKVSAFQRNMNVPELMGEFSWSNVGNFFKSGITELIKSPITITGKSGVFSSNPTSGISYTTVPPVSTIPTTTSVTGVAAKKDTATSLLKYAPLAIPFVLFFLKR